MELRKVSTEADDDSTNSLDERYTEPMDSEKGTINRSATMMSGFFFTSFSRYVKQYNIICLNLMLPSNAVDQVFVSLCETL